MLVLASRHGAERLDLELNLDEAGLFEDQRDRHRLVPVEGVLQLDDYDVKTAPDLSSTVASRLIVIARSSDRYGIEPIVVREFHALVR